MKQWHKKKSVKYLFNEQGLSLLEIVLIIIIVGIAIVPLSRIMISNLKANAQYVVMSRAIFYADEIVENILADYNSSGNAVGGYENVFWNWDGAVTSPAPPSPDLTASVSFSASSIHGFIPYRGGTVIVQSEDIEDVVMNFWLFKND